MSCPLCGEKEIYAYTVDALNRQLHRCSICEGVFVKSTEYISRGAEKNRYLKHENNLENKGYIEFLFRAVTPAMEFLKFNMRGLDYGCGKNPVLAHILKEKGFCCDVYDMYFHPELKKADYDFIFSTETFEHFSSPGKELRKIYGMLKEGGFLIIMTLPYENDTNFLTWHYSKDSTHLFFYHEHTFDYVASNYGYTIKFKNVDHGVWILQKQE